MIHRRITIWDDRANQSKGQDDFIPYLDTYILEGNRIRGAVIICPGGGYGFTSEREAEPIAMQLNAAGYHAFVLYYSVAPNRHPQPLLDLSKAMCIIRENADKWGINSDSIAVCGFSAGGHLAASLGVHWDKPYLQDHKRIDMGMNRPNAIILCYPVITGGEHAHQGSFKNLLGPDHDMDLCHKMSLEHHVSKNTPPAFLWHTCEDAAVPVENSLLFANQMARMGIPFELHIYPHGPHGLSLATSETDNGTMGTYPHVATWFKLCIEWLDGLFG